MAFALKGPAAKRLEELIDQFNEKRDTLDTVLAKFNDEMEIRWDAVKTELEAYEGIRSSLYDYVGELIESWGDAHANKPAKWRDSDKGEAVGEWIDAWRNWLGDALPELEAEEPEAVELDLPGDPNEDMPATEPDLPD